MPRKANEPQPAGPSVKDYSPFTPGYPVSVDFFVGRRAEIERIRSKIAQAAATRRLQVGFLVGERGIGKTSLAAFVRFLAHRDSKMLGLHLHLGGVSSLEEMVRRVFDELLKESAERAWYKKVREFLGEHVQTVGLFGAKVEFRPPSADLHHTVQNFGAALKQLSQTLKGDSKGIFLILDDINGLAQSDKFANWLKSTVDEIATSGHGLPLYLLVVGLEERRQALISQQPSLARVFDPVEIRPWTPEETREFYERAFAGVGTAVDDDAMKVLCHFAGGLPVLTHEIGDATFRVDKDSKIDVEDAYDGVLSAADIVGRKYLEPKVLRAIRSSKYRTILKKFAYADPDTRLGFSFNRRGLLKQLVGKERNAVDNFLQRMKKLGVIRREIEEGPGCYRFDNRLHYIYLIVISPLASKNASA